jgi:hypothetical protein
MAPRTGFGASVVFATWSRDETSPDARTFNDARFFDAID